MEKDYIYLVSARCYTYNQASFIDDTLEGFAKQKCDFPVVYCIVDDASTDGEQDVLRRWAEEHLENKENGFERHEMLDYGELIVSRLTDRKNALFVILLLNKNHYQLKIPKLPYIIEWEYNSKYLAVCEGDDYWIDPLKLQKQVEFLENHPDHGMCYGNIATIKDGEIIEDPTSSIQIDSVEKIFLNNSIANMATMSRNDLLIRYREEIEPSKRGWKMGDYPMWIWMVMESKIYHMDEVFGVYRILGESASHSQDYKKRLAFLDSTHDIRLFFANRYSLDAKLISKINDVYYRDKSIITRGNDKEAYRDALKRIKRKTAKEKIKYLLSYFGV